MTDDLISRQQAIMAIEQHRIALLEGHQRDEGIEYGYAAAHRHLDDIIEQLPSIQPEYPKGRWIPTASEKGRHECSRCHEYAPCYQDGSEHLSTFCVLCGAKMERGEQE